jgi:syndecan 4
VTVSGSVSGSSLSVTAATTVLLRGTLDATGRGRKSAGTGKGGDAPGGCTPSDCACSSGGAGGGHGGAGGKGQGYCSWDATGGGTYGDFSAPVSFGSEGGACWNGNPDSPNNGCAHGVLAGGGKVYVSAPTVTCSGCRVAADGQSMTSVATVTGVCNCYVAVSGGAGSGGSVYIATANLLGSSGTISADGGDYLGWQLGGGGGGGRVAIPDHIPAGRTVRAAGSTALATPVAWYGHGACGGGYNNNFPGAVGTVCWTVAGVTSCKCTAGRFCAAGVQPGVACPAGSSCPANTFAAAACDPGTYALAGAALCTNCPAGRYGATAGLAVSACTGLCPEGYECPLGTATPALCPAGKYSLAGAPSCTNCTAGKFSPSAGASAAAACAACAAGTFAATGAPNCTLCPAGTFSAVAGAASPATCRACAGGYFCPAGCSAGIPCGAGNYCPAGSSAPLPCPMFGMVEATKGPANGPAFDVDTAACYNHCFFGGDGETSAC